MNYFVEDTLGGPINLFAIEIAINCSFADLEIQLLICISEDFAEMIGNTQSIQLHNLGLRSWWTIVKPLARI